MSDKIIKILQHKIADSVSISALGFGCSRLGKSINYDYSKIGPDILKMAYGLGINYFDTASNYSYGDSEKILGTFIQNYEDIIISTKGGTKLSSKAAVAKYARPFFGLLRPLFKKQPTLNKRTKRFGFDAPYLQNVIDVSIDRFHGRSIDIYKIHNPDEKALKGVDIPQFFSQLKKDHKIKLAGLSLRHLNDVYKCSFLDEIDVIQIPINWASMKEEDYDTLCDLKSKNKTIIAREIFARGILTSYNVTKTGKNMGVTDERIQDRKENIKNHFQINDIQLSLWFLKDIGVFDSLLFSTFKTNHLTENVETFLQPIPAGFSWKEVLNKS